MELLNVVNGFKAPASFFTEIQNNAHNDLQKIAKLFGAGIVEGMIPTRDPVDGSVSISSGFGWDSSGRMINVSAGFALDLSTIARPAEGKYKKVAVIGSYSQEESGKIQDEIGNEFWEKKIEGIQLSFLEGDEADTENGVQYAEIDSDSFLLSDLLFDYDSEGCISIDISRRPNPANASLFMSIFFNKVDSIKYSKQLGELFFLDSYKEPLEMTSMDPGTYFPGICLDAIDGSLDISEDNWPDLVSHLRSLKLTYMAGKVCEQSAFSVIDWDISSNIASLTFDDLTAEKEILSALAEDSLVHGSYSNWRSITLPTAIGEINAGEYAITAVNVSARIIKFAYPAPNNSGSSSHTVNFYTNRVPESVTTARIYEVSGRTLVSANDLDGEKINGLLRRDRFQGFSIKTGSSFLNGDWDVSSGSDRAVMDATQSSPGVMTLVNNGYGNPRIGKTTDPMALISHLYIWGRSYIS